MILCMKDSSKTTYITDGADTSTTMESTGDTSRTDLDMEEASGWPMTAKARMEIGIWGNLSE